MKVTIRFDGSEVTGELVEKTATHTTIRVLEHKKGSYKKHAIGVWKSDRYNNFTVPNENVVSTETEITKELA